MQPLQEAQTDRAIEDEKDRYDEIEKAWHDQDEHTCDQRHDRRDMSDGQMHELSFEGGKVRG
jgi:hypothetical protein